MTADRIDEITATLICHDPSGSPRRPWAVSVSSEPAGLAVNDQLYDLTEVQGVIYCPDKAMTEEIARRLTMGRYGSDGNRLSVRDVGVTPSEVRAARWIAGRDQARGKQTPEAIRKIAAAAGPARRPLTGKVWHRWWQGLTGQRGR